MKRLIEFTFVLLFTFGSYIINCQSGVEWGPVQKGTSGFSNYYKFLGIQNNKYYFVLKPEKDNILLEYDNNHNLLNRQEYKFVKNKQRLKIHGAIQTKTGSFIYSHQLSNKYKEWILFVSDFENGQFSKPREAYFQEFELSNKRLNQKYRDFQYDFGTVEGGLIMSEDSTKVAFVNVFKREDFRKDDVISIAVMDDQLNLIWKEVFYYKFGSRDFEIEQQVVTNEGDIYLVSKEDRINNLNGKTKTIKEKNLPNFNFKVYNINQEGILDYTIDTGKNTAPMDARIFFPQENTTEFVMLGFYTNNEHRNRLKGMYFTNGDNTFESMDYKLHPFKKEFLIGLVSDKAIRKDKGLEATFDVKDMLEFADGTIGFVAEENYERVNTYYNNNRFYGNGGFYNNGINNSRREVTYYSNVIILPRFDIYGDLVSLQRIDKYYPTSFASTSSYSIAKKEDKTYLIFNDRKSRSERREIDKKGSRFTDLVILNGIGEIESRETLFSNKEIDLEFSSELSDFNDNFFLIGSTLNGRYCMGTLYIK